MFNEMNNNILQTFNEDLNRNVSDMFKYEKFKLINKNIHNIE